MANNYRALEGQHAEPVILAPVHSSYFNQISTEPQMIIRRAGNSATLFFSSQDSTAQTSSPVSAYISAPGEPTLMTRVKRMGLSYFRYVKATPVIDSTNNVFRVWCGKNNTVYTLTVQQGNWNTPQLLMGKLGDAIVAAGMPDLNLIRFFFYKNAVPSYITPPSTEAEVVLAFPYDIFILEDSPGLVYGRTTYAFPIIEQEVGTGGVPIRWNGINPVNQTTDVSNGAGGFYTLTELYQRASCSIFSTGYMACRSTRYIDILTPTLNNFTKLPTSSTRSPGAGLLHRMYFDEFQEYDTSTPAAGIVIDLVTPANNTAIINTKLRLTFEERITNPVTFCRNVDESINSIYLTILDEYGRPMNSIPVQAIQFNDPTNPALGRKKNQIPRKYNWGVSYDGAFYCEI